MITSPLTDYLINLKSTHNSFIIDIPDFQYKIELIAQITIIGCTAFFNPETKILQVSYYKKQTFNKEVQHA